MDDEGATLLYFAYGSNLYLPRMQGRVPSAMPVSVGRLPDHRLAFDKLGGDGSTKCTIHEDADDTVWGVVYRIDADDRPALDAAEGEGYEVTDIRVATPETWLDCFTYRALPEWIGRGWPYAWYRDLVLAGARNHALPADYIAPMTAITAIPDPDPARVQANRPRPW